MNLVKEIGNFFSKIIDLIFLGIEKIQNIIESNWLLEKIVTITLYILIIALLVRFILKIFSYFTE